MARISYSQLSMFSECPHKWKLNYIDKLRVSEPSIHLLFGTAMHEVIQKYLNVMYQYTVKRADMLNLERTLQEKMVEQFNIDKENAIANYYQSATEANKLGIGINAGHDLSLSNIAFFKEKISNLIEVSIGHALITESLYHGFENVISKYKKILR